MGHWPILMAHTFTNPDISLQKLHVKLLLCFGCRCCPHLHRWLNANLNGKFVIAIGCIDFQIISWKSNHLSLFWQINIGIPAFHFWNSVNIDILCILFNFISFRDENGSSPKKPETSILFKSFLLVKMKDYHYIKMMKKDKFLQS